MLKYYAERTWKTGSTILYITDTKEDAVAEGQKIFSRIGGSKDMIRVCSADFDENYQRTDECWQYYCGWRNE